MDRSQEIAKEIADVIEWESENGKLQPAASLRLILSRDDVLEVMAMAHDAEEAAQMGEPSPWRPDLGVDQDPEWRAERRTAMLCALQAVGLL